LALFVALGASYASKTGVSGYTLPATVADPGSSSFGDVQQVAFKMETPAMLVAGLSMTPLPTLLLAADVRYLFYEDAAAFGWQNVFVFNIGAEYAASDKFALRVPLPDRCGLRARIREFGNGASPRRCVTGECDAQVERQRLPARLRTGDERLLGVLDAPIGICRRLTAEIGCRSQSSVRDR